MLRLSDIMTREVVTVGPDLPVREAMELFASRHISGAPVVANRKVAGVVSVTDLMEFAATSPGVPTSRPEQQVDLGESEEVLEIADGNDSGSAFFAEMWDDAGAGADERMGMPEGPEWNSLDEHTVSEVMNRRVCALPPEASVEEAADYMRTAQIHRVLVMRDAELLGVVTTTDVARAVADHRIQRRVYVFDAPRRPAVRRP